MIFVHAGFFALHYLNNISSFLQMLMVMIMEQMNILKLQRQSPVLKIEMRR